MVGSNGWFSARGALARDGWDAVVDDTIDGWRHTGLRIATLDGVAPDLPAGDIERMIVPLAGSFSVEAGGSTDPLRGRASVFDGATDVLYAGVGVDVRITGTGRVAVAEAPATESMPVTLLPAADVPVEIRGAGRSTRQVHNFGVPGALAAQKLIVCEVITPAENWSSYPPHKHDEATATESRLEEIYYFEAAVARGVPAPPTADPFGLFATYSSPAGAIDTTALVRTGDIALVPHGFHGPAAAAPGYDLYYLNVMAGPDPARAWLISDDPAHGWIRSTWDDQTADPRLPYGDKDGSR
ncbi:MAG: 5-deoxy-glucuronate isomerase [Microbacteriaceae bacterium]|nr:5-deoxy-glucuronate isomerase [Microbacteriaceae bacterium]